MTTTEDVIRLAHAAGFQKGRFAEVILKLKDGSWINCFDQVARLISLAKAEERDACAKICEAHRDPEEYVRASRRVDEALSSGTRNDQLRALRHESEVRLYHSALNNAAKSIRDRTKEAP